MSEEIRFKYLEELERSEALDGAIDTSRERRRRRRSIEDNERQTSREREETGSYVLNRENHSKDTGRKSKRDSAAEQTGKKRKKKSSKPEREVRNVSVSENREKSRRHTGSKTSSAGTSGRKKSGTDRRRRDYRSSGREVDWDAFIEETARLEAEDSFREEREVRKKNRANAARRKEREERERRTRIIRIVSVLAGVFLLVFLVRTVIHLVKTTGSGKTEAGTYTSDATGIVSGSEDTGQGTEQNAVSTDVTVAPTSSVVSIDSADQLTTLFEDWVYEPSETDVAPEGDIVPVNDTAYSHDMMKRDLYLLRERYPDEMSILRFGLSADGRDLLDVVIGSPSAQKDVIIQYSMHAREYVNSLVAMKQIEELLKGMANGTQYNGASYSDILEGVRLHLIPMMNPDGVMIALYGFDAIGNESLRNGLYECWQSDILLGKGDPDIAAYYRRWKANARCVDINRNFDCGWETTVGTTQPSCSRYKGESAASEAETKALVALKDAINCVGQIAYHSEGEVVYWDYGSVGDLHVIDEQLADLVCGVTGYTKESTVSSDQETAGCSDYFILECGIPAITVETGVGECPIYVDQWETIWNQNSQVLPAVAQFFAQM